MKKVKGNLITLAENGAFDVIVHGCNCMCQMGAGIALEVKNKYPDAYKIDCTTKSGNRNKLGTISGIFTDKFAIVNAYTQFDWRGKNNCDYDAIRKSFESVKKRFTGKRIGYPMIGAGLAGGDWKIISKIIDEVLDGEDHTLVEWDGK